MTPAQENLISLFSQEENKAARLVTEMQCQDGGRTNFFGRLATKRAGLVSERNGESFNEGKRDD
jgi:hypothetical protein